jgi:hypothetical protein
MRVGGRRHHTPGSAGSPAASVPNRHPPVPVRDHRERAARMGPCAAARGGSVVRSTGRGCDRLPGGQVPPAGGVHPPRRAAARAPGAAGLGRQPDAGHLDRAGSPVRVDRPRRGRRRAAAHRRGLHPRAAGRVGRGGRSACARVPTAAGGAAVGAPDQLRGVGGAARDNADDGDDPKPGDDDARGPAHAGIAVGGAHHRAAVGWRADPQGPCPPDRAAGGGAPTLPGGVCAATAPGRR